MKIKNYYEVTPKKWRKLGDTLLAVSVLISTSAIVNNYDFIAISALIIGVVGKALSEFFTEK